MTTGCSNDERVRGLNPKTSPRVTRKEGTPPARSPPEADEDWWEVALSGRTLGVLRVGVLAAIGADLHLASAP